MLYKKGKGIWLYMVVGLLALLLGMAPIYYDFLARNIFFPLWQTSGWLSSIGYRLEHAFQCFTQTASIKLISRKENIITASGAYTYGYISGVRWVGNIKEFYVKLDKTIPSDADAVVVLSYPTGMIGKVEGCDKHGCWVRSIWDARIRIPVFLKPSGYIGWLQREDKSLVFTSIAAPLEPVPPYQVVYWLGNPNVKIGITTTTLSVNSAMVKPTVSHMVYEPVLVYIEVLFNDH